MAVNNYRDENGNLFQDSESDYLVGSFEDNRVHLYAIDSSPLFQEYASQIGVVGVLPESGEDGKPSVFYLPKPSELHVPISDLLDSNIIGQEWDLLGEKWIINAMELEIPSKSFNSKRDTKEVIITLHVHHISNDDEGLPMDGFDTRYIEDIPPFDKQFADSGKSQKLVSLKEPIKFRINKKVINPVFMGNY